jgi:hypothetical protein
MAKVTPIDVKRAERDHAKQARQIELKPDRWIRQPNGDMVPEDPGPSIFDVKTPTHG